MLSKTLVKVTGVWLHTQVFLDTCSAPTSRSLSQCIFIWEQNNLFHYAHLFVQLKHASNAAAQCTFRLIHKAIFVCVDKYEPHNFCQFGNE